METFLLELTFNNPFSVPEEKNKSEDRNLEETPDQSHLCSVLLEPADQVIVEDVDHIREHYQGHSLTDCRPGKLTSQK